MIEVSNAAIQEQDNQVHLPAQSQRLLWVKVRIWFHPQLVCTVGWSGIELPSQITRFSGFSWIAPSDKDRSEFYLEWRSYSLAKAMAAGLVSEGW